MAYNLVDIGANLTHASFKHDFDAMLARAFEAGVNTLILTGANVASSQAAYALTNQYAGVMYSTAGVHPHEAAKFNADTPGILRELHQHPAVVAVGETGLDYNRNYATPDEQIQAFRAQLDLAVESGLPVFLHQRDAHEPFIEIMREYRDRLSDGVAHCFTGSLAELEACLDLDLYIGITGWICDERRGHHLHDIIQRIPADRLMIETDAPYLLPRDLKPKPKDRRNEPMYLPHVLETVAKHLDKDPTIVAEETTATARQFFRLPV